MPRPRFPEAPPWVDPADTPHSATPLDYPELEESDDDDDDAGAAAGSSAEEALCAAARAGAHALALDHRGLEALPVGPEWARRALGAHLRCLDARSNHLAALPGGALGALGALEQLFVYFHY